MYFDFNIIIDIKIKKIKMLFFCKLYFVYNIFKL